MKIFFKRYKLPILIALTLGIVFIALPVIKDPLTISMVFIFSFLSVFVLDIDYILQAYFIDPDDAFSKNLKAYIKHGDYFGALRHVELNENTVKDKTLNSGLFQSLFALFCIFVVSSPVYFPIKAFVLAVLANTIYKIIEIYFKKELADWFWSFKKVPDKNGFLLYLLYVCSIFGYCLFLL